MNRIYVDLLTLMAKKRIRTVSFLAKETDLSRMTLYKLINRKTTRIDFETILILCDYFDCEIGDLLIFEKDKAV